MLIKNNNAYFGMEGPWEVKSKEALADEMMPTFKIWAKEDYEDPNMGGDPNKEEWINQRIAETRKEFIKGLEEV